MIWKNINLETYLPVKLDHLEKIFILQTGSFEKIVMWKTGSLGKYLPGKLVDLKLLNCNNWITLSSFLQKLPSVTGLYICVVVQSSPDFFMDH